MPLSILLGLILCNIIWSAAPVGGVWVLQDFTPIQGAWLRYVSAFAFYVMLTVFLIVTKRAKSPPFLKSKHPKDWATVIAIGAITFCGVGILQLKGLSTSRATDNALIIAMEPIITVVLAWVIFRDRMQWNHVVSFSLSIVGFSLLSGLTPAKIRAGFDPHLMGNLLIFCSLLGEAAYSLLARGALKRNEPTEIFGTALFFGGVFLTIITLLGPGLPPLHQFTWKSAAGSVWNGVLGTGICYLFWMVALTRISIASITVTLFIQPVVGSLIGYLVLGDLMTPIQFIGAALILLGVSVQLNKKLAVPI
ncbi:DMT family transporter [bacterium]|jgi:drug/metabolite transporter (DMT)-like permease|nr:DMT family transporter [bacterium]